MRSTNQCGGSCPVQHPNGCPISNTSTIGCEGVVKTSHSPPPLGIVSVSPSAYMPNGCSCGSLVWIPSSCGAQREVFLGSNPSIPQSIFNVMFCAGSPVPERKIKSCPKQGRETFCQSSTSWWAGLFGKCKTDLSQRCMAYRGGAQSWQWGCRWSNRGAQKQWRAHCPRPR